MLRNKIIMTTIFISAFFSITGCGTQEEKSTAEKYVPVKVANVKEELIKVPVRTTGIVGSSEESKLSFKIPGIIKRVLVKEGQNVKKGQVLASLDLSEIKANLSKAENALLKAQRDFSRAKNLYADEVATLEQLQNSQTVLDIAKADLDIARFNYNYSEIRAPSNGKILIQSSEENELINAGYPVFLFGSSGGNWKLNSGVADVEVVKISLNDSAIVRFDVYPDKQFKAFVSEIAGTSDPMTGTYQVELEIMDGSNLKSGLVGSAEIYAKEFTAAVLVPIESIVEADMNAAFLFMPAGPEGVIKRKIIISGFYDDMIAVVGGLSEGDRIIVSGAEYLNEQSKIKVIN